ncbi:MAG: hypothetical protein ACK4OE_15535 [Acidovorax sp.]
MTMVFEDGVPEDELPQEAMALWGKVFELSNTILHQNKMYGFEGIREHAPDPSITTIVQYCRFFDQAFDSVMLFDAIKDIGYETRRCVLNAKKQVTTMEQLALAVQGGNKADYDAAVEALGKQAPF